MKNISITNNEYALLMRTLEEALIADNFGPKHEDLSVLFHTIGSLNGYPWDDK